MFDFTQGTQAKAWLFQDADELATLRAKANRLAKEGITEDPATVPMPRSFAAAATASAAASNGTSSTSTGRPPRPPPPPPPPPTTGVKRPRPDDMDNTDANTTITTPTPSPADLNALYPEDEAKLLRYFAYMIQDSCGPKSESIKRGPHVQATALTFFKRFFLSNSMLDYDPKVVLMACMFLAGKVEYEYIRLTELKDVFGEKYAKAIIDFEGRLLQGVGFHLKCFHPYNPFLGLVNGLENVNKVKKLGLASTDLGRLSLAGQELIDLILPSDLPLLHAPGRVALGVLLVCAEDLGLVEQVEAYLSYCFEEEDEYGGLMEEVSTRIRPVIEQEKKEWPATLEERKQSQMGMWKEAMSKLKKASRWGATAKGEKKRKKSKSVGGAGAGGGDGGGGGDAGSVASK